MKMKAISLIGINSIILLSSCVTYHFEPMEGTNIQVKSNRSSSYPVYQDANIGMIIDPAIHGQDIMLKITVKNLSTKTISLNDGDFSIQSSDDKYIWKSLKVYGSKEYYTNARNAYIAGAVLMVAASAASAYSAGRGTAYTSGNVYGRNSYGSYSGSYSGTTSYYDPAAAELANQRSAANVSSYAQNGQQWLTTLENNLFYSKDLAPDENYFGLVFSESDSSKYYRVTCNNPDIGIIRIEYAKVSNQ